LVDSLYYLRVLDLVFHSNDCNLLYSLAAVALMCSLKLTLTGKEQKQKQATPAEYEMLTCGRYDNTFDPQPFDLAKLPNNCRWQPREL